MDISCDANNNWSTFLSSKIRNCFAIFFAQEVGVEQQIVRCQRRDCLGFFLVSRSPAKDLVPEVGCSSSPDKMTEAMIRKKPGMVSVKEMPVLQDGPPPGGFPPVRYARRIPSKGPSAVAIFLTALGAFSWGMYQVGKGNKIRRDLKEEKYAARRALVPVLQAEEDERFVKEWKKYLQEEARIMKDVPGWKVGESVYHSGKWMPPASGQLRPEVW